MTSYKFEVNTDIVLQPHEDEHLLLQPAHDNEYNLTYACLLIPRFHTHYLTGDLVEYLNIWMQEICISYGWKLGIVNVQPEYLQWLVEVPVSVSPAQIIRSVRRQTSKYIFEDFPRFRKQNVGKDFWAPGYFVIVSNQLHSPRMIQEYISFTRQQQAAGSLDRGW